MSFYLVTAIEILPHFSHFGTDISKTIIEIYFDCHSIYNYKNYNYENYQLLW